MNKINPFEQYDTTAFQVEGPIPAAEDVGQMRDPLEQTPQIETTVSSREGSRRLQPHKTTKRILIADLVELDASGRARYTSGVEVVRHDPNEAGERLARTHEDGSPVTRSIKGRFISAKELDEITLRADDIREGAIEYERLKAAAEAKKDAPDTEPTQAIVESPDNDSSDWVISMRQRIAAIAKTQDELTADLKKVPTNVAPAQGEPSTETDVTSEESVEEPPVTGLEDVIARAMAAMAMAGDTATQEEETRVQTKVVTGLEGSIAAALASMAQATASTSEQAPATPEVKNAVEDEPVAAEKATEEAFLHELGLTEEAFDGASDDELRARVFPGSSLRNSVPPVRPGGLNFSSDVLPFKNDPYNTQPDIPVIKVATPEDLTPEQLDAERQSKGNLVIEVGKDGVEHRVDITDEAVLEYLRTHSAELLKRWDRVPLAAQRTHLISAGLQLGILPPREYQRPKAPNRLKLWWGDNISAMAVEWDLMIDRVKSWRNRRRSR